MTKAGISATAAVDKLLKSASSARDSWASSSRSEVVGQAASARGRGRKAGRQPRATTTKQWPSGTVSRDQESPRHTQGLAHRG